MQLEIIVQGNPSLDFDDIHWNKNDPRLPVTFIVFIAIGSAMPRDVDGREKLKGE